MQTKYRFFILFSFIFWLNLASAQNTYPMSTISPELLKNAEAVVRLDETVMDIASLTKGTVTRRQVVTFLKKPSASDLRLTVAEREGEVKVKAIKGKIYDATGAPVRESEKSEVENLGDPVAHQFTNTRYRVLEMDYNDLPFTLEFFYKMEFSDFVNIPDWTVRELEKSVEHTSFSITAPAGYEFQWKAQNIDIQPKININGKEKTWYAEIKNQPALPYEPWQPYFASTSAQVIFAPEKFERGGHAGSMHDWASFGRFIYELNRDRDQLPPDMAEKVRQITAPAHIPAEKIAVLYRYLQENYRYVSVQIGIGGWQSFDAAYVAKNKYGDCKALSNFMRAMLKTAGIESWLAAVYGDSDGAPPVTEDFLNPAFNHMILYVPSTNTWLECTSQHRPPGFPGGFTANRKALLLTPEGGKLVSTHTLSIAENRRSTRATLTINELGMASVESFVQMEGEREEGYRELVANTKGEDVQKKFAENLGFSLARINQLDIQPLANKPETMVRFHVDINNYATRSGKRIFLSINKLHPFGRTLPVDTARVNDLSIPFGYTVTDTLTFMLPPGYGVENTPADATLASDFGKYELRLEKSTNQVQVFRHIELPPIQVPAARYTEVQQFFARVSQADAQQMVLVKS